MARYHAHGNALRLRMAPLRTAVAAVLVAGSGGGMRALLPATRAVVAASSLASGDGSARLSASSGGDAGSRRVAWARVKESDTDLVAEFALVATLPTTLVERLTNGRFCPTGITNARSNPRKAQGHGVSRQTRESARWSVRGWGANV